MLKLLSTLHSFFILEDLKIYTDNSIGGGEWYIDHQKYITAYR